MQKRLFLAVMALLSVHLVNAQAEETSFSATGRGGTATSFVTDYQAIGINPANLGFDTDYGFAIGIGEMGYGAFSDALLRDDVRGILFSEDSITAEEQETLAREFLDAGITMNVDVMPVGFSIRLPKIGTFGFAVKGNMAYHTRFAGQAANIVWEGYDYSEYIDTVIYDGTTFYGVAYEPLSMGELFEDTEISLSINTEFNVAYGRKIAGKEDGVDLFGGFGYKYILGLAYLDINSDEGVFTGRAALGLDLVDFDPDETPFQVSTNPYEPVGTGHGFDLGLSLKINDGLTFGIAMVDIGSITYTTNVLTIYDYTLDTIAFSGLTSTDPLELVSQLLGDEPIFSFSGDEDFTVALPTKLRMGGSVKFSDALQVGLDAVFPVNTVAGNLTTPVLGIGAQMRLLKVLKLSAGISAGGGYAYNIPAGIGVDFGLWEAGVASRDIVTWFGEESPTVSFAFGFLRFKI